jgi:phosphoribosyl-ATP pyrophosphohydrolase/phosphoribosyl-AMP cyclohydrolase
MIIPSIDLMNGKAVQLVRGIEKKLERENILELAKSFSRFGEIAVIDLDAAMGNGNNREWIKKLAKEFPVRVGGGLRTVDEALEILRAGAEKVIIGSAAIAEKSLNEEFLNALIRRAGKQNIILAMDVVNDQIATRGWKEKTEISIWDVLEKAARYTTELLVTDVDQEGTMQGIRKNFYRKLAQTTSLKITAAGGTGKLEDIAFLAGLGMNVQLGMSIYTNSISLEDAFIAGIHWKDELLPTIVRDPQGRILMLAYSSPESLRKSLETGVMWFYSRSRKTLWMKGETSGHIQKIISLRLDCDNDTILVTVDANQVACHTGKYSCFDEKPFTLKDLYQIIEERYINPTPGSYTATLTDRKVKEKILEEAQEVVEFTDKENLIWEVGDLLYFISVFMVQHHIEWKDILRELRRRRLK